MRLPAERPERAVPGVAGDEFVAVGGEDVHGEVGGRYPTAVGARSLKHGDRRNYTR